MCRSICSSHGSVCADLDLPVGSVAVSPFVGVQSGSPGRSTVRQLRRHPMTRSVKSLWCARQSGSSHQRYPLALQTWSTEQLQLSSLCWFSSISCLHSWIQMSRSNQFRLLTKGSHNQKRSWSHPSCFAISQPSVKLFLHQVTDRLLLSVVVAEICFPSFAAKISSPRQPF